MRKKKRWGRDKRGDIEKLEVPCDRCGILGSGHFRNRRSCGRSLGSRRGGGLKDCRGNQCDGQQDGNQAVPQPAFIQFLYCIFYHKYFSLLVFFFLYIFYNIYMVCKKIHTTKNSGVFLYIYIINQMNYCLSNWLSRFEFHTLLCNLQPHMVCQCCQPQSTFGILRLVSLAL